MIQIHLAEPVDQTTMNKVTAVLDKRLNVFGVKDVQVRQSGNQDVIVSIAGVQPDEVAKVVGTPGKFEAKIGNVTALSGTDITTVEPYQVTGTTCRQHPPPQIFSVEVLRACYPPEIPLNRSGDFFLS